jgi:predicted DNA-binding protein (UPF0251 family)
MNKDSLMAAALADYKKGALTTKDIAAHYGISQSTLTVWATNAGFKLRSRGRRKLMEPTTRQREILRLAEVHTYEQVGQRFDMKKQAIHRIVRQWRTWMKPKRPPFVVGDIIQWQGQRLTVLSAGLQSGTLRNAKGKIFMNFPWNHRGKLPTKVG